MSAECARLAVDLERLLPKVDAEDLDEDRRIAFAEAALSKIAALETAADGDAAVAARSKRSRTCQSTERRRLRGDVPRASGL